MEYGTITGVQQSTDTMINSLDRGNLLEYNWSSSESGENIHSTLLLFDQSTVYSSYQSKSDFTIMSLIIFFVFINYLCWELLTGGRMFCNNYVSNVFSC